MSEGLSIRLFGEMKVCEGEEAVSGLHLREGERLLAYLALNHGVPQTYRKLAQIFWPMEARQNDLYEGGSFPCTRQAIHSLRRVMGVQAWRLKSPAKGVVALDLSGAEVDLLEFERLVQSEDLQSLQRAIELHHAPLLESWTESRVEETRKRCLRSLERVAQKVKTAILADPALVRKPESKARSIVEESAKLEAPGGAVPRSSAFYIERQTDVEFKLAISRQDSIVLVKGARQIGKTSLLARGLQQARLAGQRVIITDFQSLSEQVLSTADALYRTFAEDIADQLNLETLPGDVWNDRRSAGRNLERYLGDFVLISSKTPVVWGLDEIDRLFGCPCANEVFGLFRSWHNRRALDPSGPWSRLTLAIAYATEAHLFITDPNQSPFNVGTRLSLSDFTRTQVEELNRLHDSPLPSEEEVARFHALVGGHPYLVRCGLAEMASRNVTLATLSSPTHWEEGPFGEHLLRLRNMLSKSVEMTSVMGQILRGSPKSVSDDCYALRSAGVVVSYGKGFVRPRCQLYGDYLSKHLLP